MVRPVDLQHVMLKSGAAEKWQQVVQQQQEITSMESALEALKEADINKERVKHLESKEEVKVREEGKESRSGESYESPDEQVDREPKEEEQDVRNDETKKKHRINIVV